MNSEASGPRASDLSPEERFEYSARHIYYELVMLRTAISHPPSDDPFIQTALLEVCVIHARNLIEFLIGKTSGTTLGHDLFLEPGHEWAPPTLSPALAELRFRANKQVAHLTTSRRERGQPEVPYERAAFLELLSVFDDFVEHASPCLLDKKTLRGEKPSGLVVQTEGAMHMNAVSETFFLRSD